MPVNQRFIESFDWLKKNGYVKSQAAFQKKVGVIDKNRFQYLYGQKRDVDSLKSFEIDSLEAHYPVISWRLYVNTGKGELLAENNPESVAEPMVIYNSKEWRQEQLAAIVSGVSELDIHKQLEILRAAYVEQSQELTEAKDKLLKAKEISESSLLDELKRMIKKG